MPTFEQDAATVKRLLAEHIPTPDHRRRAAADGERIARALRAAGATLPAQLAVDALGPLLDAAGVTSDPLTRRHVRDALVLLRVADASRARRR